ncbi:MAG: SusC/RagA family TonB-linked outer membrane protein [Gemmatimonadaceae bacterium]
MRLWRVTAIGSAVFAGMAFTASAQTRSISGTVRDSVTGESVTAGAVLVKGTTIGTAVRPNGQFVLTSVPQSDVMLIVRSLGYRGREIPAPASASTIDVRLERDVFKIEQVVVTGQATTIERRNAPNAVALVDAADLAMVPTASIEQQLVGKIAGADIVQNSGAPGGGVQVRLRGVTSVNADAQPLYVVDGVLMSDVAIASNQNAVTQAAGGANPSLTQDGQVNRIADLNPNDIETIEVLKGASASAIYGGRASNGVVIITTRRGRSGGVQVNARQRAGISQVLNRLKTRRFNTVAEVDAAYGAGTAARNNWQPGAFYDNEQFLVDGNKPVRETVVSLSGGSDNAQYFASAQLQDDEGVVTNTGFRRESMRLNVDQRIGARFSMALSTPLMHSRAQRGLTNNDNTSTSYWYALAFTPSIVDLRARNGVFPNNPFSSSNPLQTAALMRNREDVYRFSPVLRGNFEALSGATQNLRFTALGGVDYFVQKNALFFPPELQFEPQDGFAGTSLLGNSDNLNMNFDLGAIHAWTPGSGFTATTSVGAQYVTRKLDISRITSRNLVAGQSNVDAGTAVGVRQVRQPINNAGLFVQEQVQLLDDRLTVNLGLRGDRSSLNADAEKYYYFPKAAASYRFDRVAMLDELKVRGAYGESGNEPLFGQRFTPLTASQNITGLPGLIVAGTTGARDLRPERQREVELGADGSLFNRRANFEATVYQKLITDLLLTRNLPPSSGFAFENFNGGELRTRGVEVAVGVIPVQSVSTNWVFRTTFSRNRGVITALPVPRFATGGFGISLGSFQIERDKSATQILGVDTTRAGRDTVVALGDANPDFRMSFTNDITWKRLGLHALVEWQKGTDVVNLTKLLYDFGQTTIDYADPVTGSSRTKGERRLDGFGRVLKPNYLEDGSFVKVREVALYYDLPSSLVSSLWRGLASARVSVSGRNLVKWWDYQGMDPEVSNFGNQAIARNIDVAPYPPSRQLVVSIDIRF